ncbi:D-threitol dehydrogenase-like [Haemaphysalis longicornis]
MATCDKVLSGRLAVVTGGGGCIGSAICRLLAEKGARLVVADINLESAEASAAALPSTSDGDHRAIQVDVGSAESVQCLFDEIRNMSVLPASILVNCAGNGGQLASFYDTTEEVFDSVIRSNLKKRTDDGRVDGFMFG